MPTRQLLPARARGREFTGYSPPSTRRNVRTIRISPTPRSGVVVAARGTPPSVMTGTVRVRPALRGGCSGVRSGGAGARPILRWEHLDAARLPTFAQPAHSPLFVDRAPTPAGRSARGPAPLPTVQDLGSARREVFLHLRSGWPGSAGGGGLGPVVLRVARQGIQQRTSSLLPALSDLGVLTASSSSPAARWWWRCATSTIIPA